ncbi:MAG: amino acid aminotransferase [Pseudomonadota bacterium]
MFEKLESLPGDPILSIMAAFREDPSADKIDLSAGVYKDPDGTTPIMTAVAEAEQKVLAEQTTKAYVGIAGNVQFNAAIEAMLFGDDHPARLAGRVRTLQSPGGSGGLRVAAEFFKRTNPAVRLWLSEPSWPNHEPLIGSAGIAIERYPYLDRDSGRVAFDAMLKGLEQASRGDLLLLHGCCHNPSGADLSNSQWDALAEFCRDTGLVPFVDTAYQGFGDGLDEDAYGVRRLAATVPELIAVGSCSKNFGLYKERVGAVSVLGATPDDSAAAFSHMLRIVRRIYSMPPDHGAAIVANILDDPALKHAWLEELADCRERMQRLRRDFAAALNAAMPGEDFDFLTGQKGMFSILPLTPDEVARLAKEHHIYMVASGRINIAGLPESGLTRLATAIAAVRRAG